MMLEKDAAWWKCVEEIVKVRFEGNAPPGYFKEKARRCRELGIVGEIAAERWSDCEAYLGWRRLNYAKESNEP